jgi:hypothetical protein
VAGNRTTLLVIAAVALLVVLGINAGSYFQNAASQAQCHSTPGHLFSLPKPGPGRPPICR